MVAAPTDQKFGIRPSVADAATLDDGREGQAARRA
jgi:hypothetical protein